MPSPAPPIVCGQVVILTKMPHFVMGVQRVVLARWGCEIWREVSVQWWRWCYTCQGDTSRKMNSFQVRGGGRENNIYIGGGGGGGGGGAFQFLCNGACLPGRHYLDFCYGALTVIQVSLTHLLISTRNLKVPVGTHTFQKSCIDLTWMNGYQDRSPGNGCRVICWCSTAERMWYNYPSASEATLKNIGEKIILIWKEL